MTGFGFCDHATQQQSFFYPERSQGGDRMTQEGYEIGAWGETIACGQETAEETLETWQRSQGHNEILMFDGYQVVGIGIAEDSTECSPYWTADFAAARDVQSLLPRPKLLGGSSLRHL